jgi:hypothetical protein
MIPNSADGKFSPKKEGTKTKTKQPRYTEKIKMVATEL